MLLGGEHGGGSLGALQQNGLAAQVARQLHVGGAVANDEGACQVARAVHVARQHGRARLARRGVVGGEGAVDVFAGKVDVLAGERVEHEAVGGPEGVLGKARRAQPVLVADEHRFEVERHDLPQGGDDVWQKGEFRERVNLLVGRLAQNGAVAVDEEHASRCGGGSVGHVKRRRVTCGSRKGSAVTDRRPGCAGDGRSRPACRW